MVRGELVRRLFPHDNQEGSRMGRTREEMARWRGEEDRERE
jgi:hypothetical protein